MNLKYDFHIHTALSACAVDEMTPNNIVNMAILSDLDVIAIADHNTCENVNAVIEVTKDTDLLVIPAIEVSTSEEIHVLCLFLALEDARYMKDLIYKKLPKIKTNEKIFGKQLLMDQNDDVIGKLNQLLSFSTDISIDEIIDIVDRLGGIAIPAHVDRPTNSIVSNLGSIPDYLNIPTIEISRHVSMKDYEDRYKNYQIIQTSDAHELGYIGICNQEIEVEEKTIQGVINSLKRKK